MTKKRLAVFIDGTGNDDETNTSVWRLYSLCKAESKDNLPLRKFYTKGVGTRYGSKFRGDVAGFGLDELIRDAYQWLIENHAEGDEVFIFGFSRGAYGARSLAGFLAYCGILRPGSPIGVGELFDHYKEKDPRSLKDLLELQQAGQLNIERPLEHWMVKFSSMADVAMVGVWDTVGALFGERGELKTGLRHTIRNAYHAMAIDEHRRPFVPTLYTINNPRDGAPVHYRPLEEIEQRWFSGAHANIGGGYASDLLPQPALAWMMTKAYKLGLRFHEKLPAIENLTRFKPVDSLIELGGLYLLASGLRTTYRVIGTAPKVAGITRTENVNETIDQTVFQRWREDTSYRPKNLIEWASRMGVRDPGELSTTVVARNYHKDVSTDPELSEVSF